MSFINRFRKLSNNSQSLVIRNNSSQNLIDHISNEIELLDRQILQTQEALIQAASVGIRTKVFGDRNLLSRMTNRFYFSLANDSANWHKTKLIELQKQRISLQFRLERLNGTFWINRLKRWLFVLLAFVSFGFFISLFIIAIFFTLSLLPFILLFLVLVTIFYYFSVRSNHNFY